MATKVIVEPKIRERLRRLVRGAYIPSVLADKILQSQWLKDIMAEAYDAGFRDAEYQHDGFAGVSGWVNNNPWRGDGKDQS